MPVPNRTDIVMIFILRFVKLFPLINEHDSGLVRFGKYLSRQIAKIGEDNLKVSVLHIGEICFHIHISLLSS